jgi:hypothetical protein
LDYGSFNSPLAMKKLMIRWVVLLKLFIPSSCSNFEFVCENHSLKNYSTFIFIFLKASDSYCYLWGCKGSFFVFKNSSIWCPINFGSSLPRSPLVQSTCWGELFACDFWPQWGPGGEMGYWVLYINVD